MDAANVVSLVIALIAAASAYASQRASARANKAARIESARIELESSRVGMEKSAYERARSFDTETIARQHKRISELSREVRRLSALVVNLRAGIDDDVFGDFDEP